MRIMLWIRSRVGTIIDGDCKDTKWVTSFKGVLAMRASEEMKGTLAGDNGAWNLTMFFNE